ncbi:hypothetical protein K435DRAFT_727949 [Dendrothele bispora CBS 962.96]|uniref:Uncharacterized protein n=1 Tax=Dendrothele bispora (strain CBS 962.96) TaxID=1314807 RepID=A0A4S8LPL9_DENBC|nr:hypothetical protein K435DRAFT_727949 [Dendrothele bispora CBS 962.96]
MPPPPVPATASQTSILEPEMCALAGCLRAIKTAQILNFYADARRLAIQKHASAPPHRLQAALGHEIEKYDQLCDSIEAHLLRAIAVLQRDADKEELQRKKEAEAAAAAEAAKQAAGIGASSSEVSNQVEQANASDTSSQATVPLGRRPSTISIQSLHRPAHPLKIDLSPTSLRLSGEGSSLLSDGLPSPVTLAPKSARPLENFDYMAAFASSSSDSNTIDLTLPDHTRPDAMNMDLNPSLGNSADKPIELDMDGMDIHMDLFGDETTPSTDTKNVELFPPMMGSNDSSEVKEGNFLSALGVDGSTNNDLFASLDTREADSRPAPLDVPSSETQNVLSPDTIIASLNQAEGTSSNNVSGPSFDLTNLDDLGFFTEDQDSDMQNLEHLWNMGDAPMDMSGASGSGESGK